MRARLSEADKRLGPSCGLMEAASICRDYADKAYTASERKRWTEQAYEFDRAAEEVRRALSEQPKALSGGEHGGQT
jgi:hypothetical protein